MGHWSDAFLFAVDRYYTLRISGSSCVLGSRPRAEEGLEEEEEEEGEEEEEEEEEDFLTCDHHRQILEIPASVIDSFKQHFGIKK